MELLGIWGSELKRVGDAVGCCQNVYSKLRDRLCFVNNVFAREKVSFVATRRCETLLSASFDSIGVGRVPSVTSCRTSLGSAVRGERRGFVEGIKGPCVVEIKGVGIGMDFTGGKISVRRTFGGVLLAI